jgi:predicted alpha/beta-fold hydrolase
LIADHPPFRPFKPIHLPHFQTVGAFFLRGKQSTYSATKRIVNLFDGDRLVIHDDKPANWITGDRIVILLHGYCGCYHSPYMRRTTDKLHRRGIRTIRVDFRGFGDSALVSRGHLHGGCSFDVQSVLDHVHRLCPISKISLIGFSLGGNILMKLLGEWGDNHPEYVDSAVAVSPPVDLIYASWNIRQRGNRLYEAYFIHRLKTQLTLRRRKVKDLVDNNLNPLPNRLIHWDDKFTAPIWGFRGAKEYYEKASSGPLLKNVRVPSIMLWAHDDPVVPYDSCDRFDLSSSIEVISTRRGGHLGFIGRKVRDPDKYWMDWRICNWIASLDEV